MKTVKTGIAIAVILVGSLVVLAQTDLSGSGNRLIIQCASALRYADDPTLVTTREQADVGYCIGLVRGETDVLVQLGKISVPKNMPSGQIVRVVEKYLQSGPGELANPDTVLVYRALIAAFPPKMKDENGDVKK